MGSVAKYKRSVDSVPGGWLQSLKKDTMTFLKGESTGGWAILAETVIGCVPVLGQLVDARDIIKAIIILSANPTSPAGWFDLITALIGLVPGGGDAVKMSLKSVKKGALPMDSILDGIRKLGKGDPEQLIRKCLNLNALQKNLDKILTNPQVLNQLSPQARKNVDQIRRNLSKQLQIFKKEVDGWLLKSRKTSADANKNSKNQTNKPNSPANGGQKANNTNHSKSNSTNNSSIGQTAITNLSNKFKGILGEHMADYYCQEVKGWGTSTHDKTGTKNSHKLNDNGEMVNLFSIKSRGRGIDGVWKKSNSDAKPYAIIEAKCSQNPAASLRDLLGDANDKNGIDKSIPQQQQRSGRTSRNRTNTSSTNRNLTLGGEKYRDSSGKVVQMSHHWITNRLVKSVGIKLAPIILKKRRYERYVIFFSGLQVVEHAVALIKFLSKQTVTDKEHSIHKATRVWTDKDISIVVNNK